MSRKVSFQTFVTRFAVTEPLRLNFEAVVKEINDNVRWFVGKKTTRVFLTATGRPS